MCDKSNLNTEIANADTQELIDELKRRGMWFETDKEKFKKLEELIECLKYKDDASGAVDNRQRADWAAFNKGIKRSLRMIERFHTTF